MAERPCLNGLDQAGWTASHLFFLSKDAATVSRNGAVVMHFGLKSCVGEFVRLTGEPALGTVTLTEDSCLFGIESDNLRRFAARSGEIAEALESSIAHEIGRKMVDTSSRLRGEAKV